MASSHLRAIAAITMTALLVSVAACNVSDYQVPKAPEGPGTLHLQNGALPAGPVDVWFDDSVPVKVVSALAFGDTITLTGVKYGTHYLKFSTAGNTDSLAGFPIFVSTGRMYTEALGGDFTGAGADAILGGQVSAASVLPAQNAGLRVFHTLDVNDYAPPASDTTWFHHGGQLGITLVGQTTGTTVTNSDMSEFGSLPPVGGTQIAPGFQSLPPDTYTLIAWNAVADPITGAVDTLTQSGITITLKAGQLRTVLIAGFGPATPKPAMRFLTPVADSGQ